MTRIPINPELPTWARKRAGLDALTLAELSMCGYGRAREVTP